MARIIRRKGGVEEELHHRSGLEVLTVRDEPFDVEDPDVAADLVLDGTERFEADPSDQETAAAVSALQAKRDAETRAKEAEAANG
jgi:hypothetical protein